MGTRRPTADASGAEIEEATASSAALLAGADTSAWPMEVPGIGWSVSQTVAHMAEGCLWYAIDLTAGGVDLPTVVHRVKAEREPAELLATLRTYATILRYVVDSVPDTQRGYHPFGMADRSGFAAMACDELLVHTYDAALALSLDFTPPPGLAQSTLLRLFPWTTDCQDSPWQCLLWANGRIALPGRERLSTWRWHCAPLAEWDGRPPFA